MIINYYIVGVLIGSLIVISVQLMNISDSLKNIAEELKK